MEELEALSGIGKARAAFFISRRPYDALRTKGPETRRAGIKKTLDAMDSPELSDKLLRFFR
ncbi:MAG: hypothetical protein LBG29_09185 [Synergistaceae bacterium]|jgi:hypothetical protein|nr:hypothetical protein [Synergistaceae bacterium]